MAKIKGNDNANTLFGTTTDDQIYGYGGKDILIGGGGHDTLDGGTDADDMYGGIGNDTYIVDNVDDDVFELANDGHNSIVASVSYSLNWAPHVEDLVLTGSGADIDGYGNSLENDIIGTSGDNDLWGFGGNDVLKGGGGDDYLNGGDGTDTMSGGTGDDYYVVNAGDTVIEYNGEGYDTVEAFGDYKLANNVEKLIMTGTGNSSGHGNSLKNVILGNSHNNYINGGLGADDMRGWDGNDRYVVDNEDDVIWEFADHGRDTVYSTIDYTLGDNLEWLSLMGSDNIDGSGNELGNLISGNEGNNVLRGYEGKDTLDGWTGADTMYGGTGDDVYNIWDDGDVVVELADEGNDTVRMVGDLDGTLVDKAHIEDLHLDFLGHGLYATGNALQNKIWGSIYNNTIDGGLGADTMDGENGDDSYIVDIEGDVVVEGSTIGSGHDIVYSYVDEVLDANVEELSLAIGNAISGIGNGDNNVLYGNTQNNFLNGGDGADQLSGLGGNDTFVFQAGQAQGDTVFEFEGNGDAAGDVLYFTGYGTAADGATFMQQTATDWVITSADGLISETITLAGAPAVGTLDYLFV